MAVSMASGSNPGGGLGLRDARSLVKVRGAAGASSCQAWSSKGSFSGGQVVPLLKPGTRQSFSLSCSSFLGISFPEVVAFVNKRNAIINSH